jgi:hypothetical protein
MTLRFLLQIVVASSSQRISHDTCSRNTTNLLAIVGAAHKTGAQLGTLLALLRRVFLPQTSGNSERLSLTNLDSGRRTSEFVGGCYFLCMKLVQRGLDNGYIVR